MAQDTYAPAEGKSARASSSRSLLQKHEFFHRINGDKLLRDSSVRVAGFLMWRLNCEREECFPGRQSVADATGLSLRTVGEALRELRDHGWLTWRERKKSDGSPMSSMFTFVWDRAESDTESYVHLDKTRPQDPDALARAGKSCQEGVGGKSRQGGMAEAASITMGRITREGSSLSSASPQKEPARAQKLSPSAETRAAAIYSPNWWKDQVWLIVGPEFKTRFYPTISKSEFGKRLGVVIKRQQHDLPKVHQAMLDTLKAEPGGDAFEYIAGILRSGPGKSRPIDELDANYRPRAPIVDSIM